MLWLGPPQEPDSVCVQFQFAPWVEVLPAAPVESAERRRRPPSEDAFLGAAVTHDRDSARTRPARSPPALEEPPSDEEVEPAPADAASAEPPPSLPMSSSEAARRRERADWAEPAAAIGGCVARDDPFFVGEPLSSAPAPCSEAEPVAPRREPRR